MFIPIKSAAEIESLKAAGIIHRAVMQQLIQAAVVGVSTGELDDLAEEAIRAAGAVPSFKGYSGFPGSICTSINEEIVHGIPSHDRLLSERDLLKLDLGVYYQGMHADAGRTVVMGSVGAEAIALAATAQEAFQRVLPFVKAGAPLNRIGQVVEDYAHAQGFEVVRDLIGHGVGRALHEPPEVPNFYRRDLDVTLKAGMALAIEPMVNMGTWRIKQLKDHWTIVTADGRLSAYYEDTVLVTESGFLIIT